MTSSPAAVGPPTTVLYTLDRDSARPGVVDLARQLDPLRFRLVFASFAEPAPAASAPAPAPASADTADTADAAHAAHAADLDVADQLRSLGFPVVSIAAGPALAGRLRRVVRDLAPDVVHIALSRHVPTVLAVSRAARVSRRVVRLPTEAWGQWPGLRGAVSQRAVRTLVDAWATGLVGTSEVAMRRAWGEEWRLDPRCRLVYPGIAIEPFGVAIAARRRSLDIGADADPDVVGIVHLGRGEPTDNRGRALDVVAALRGRGVNARLRVAGPCPLAERQRLLARAAQRGMAGHLEFVGADVEPAKLLVASSMTLLTSAAGRGEPPRPVLDSCAVGTPVLSVDLPAVREIARLLPGVTMLPLGADDEVWADTARALTVASPTLDERREALRLFVRSPFTAANWQREMATLWS